MRKSRHVPLTILAAVALSAVGCHDDKDGPRRCVDAQNHILADSACEDHPSGNGGVHGTGGVHYVYGGSSGGHLGDTVVGASESGVSRGGFGHGGGEGGEGGGHGGGE